ncbi:MAG: phenylacetate--CoA ligase family protein [Myxococcales bacterium]|nr:phenylacetate--CoA ligase family protein [Myxococcales bacterium]
MARVGLGPDPHARSASELGLAYARGAGTLLPQLLGNPWLPKPVLRRLVERRRGRILRHAMENVPHYRDAFAAAGLSRTQLADPELFAEVPFLEKRHVKDCTEQLIWPEVARAHLLERKSSGSTGSPVRVYFDPVAELPRRVQELRFLTAHGCRPRHTQMILDAPAHLAPKAFLPQRLSLWRREPYPWWMTPEAAIDEINRRQPDVFHGVLAGVRMLALAIEAAGGLEYRPFRVVTKGELLDPSTRWFIENAFGAKVVDFYATEETGIIAWECPSGGGGYHIDSDFNFVEIVRPDGSLAEPGEVGEVVLTNLYQRAMPIIRYRVGDLAALSPEPCACGRSLPLLRQLRGRKLDFLVTPAGELHDPFRVMAVMEQVQNVRWFRVIQTALERVEVRVGWETDASPATRGAVTTQIQAGLRELLGEGMQIDVVTLDEFRVEIGEKAPLVKGLPGQELQALAERGYKLAF